VVAVGATLVAVNDVVTVGATLVAVIDGAGSTIGVAGAACRKVTSRTATFVTASVAPGVSIGSTVGSIVT